MVHSIHGSYVGQQRLSCADVGGGLVTPDVLLARLHGHAQRWVAISIPADACKRQRSDESPLTESKINLQLPRSVILTGNVPLRCPVRLNCLHFYKFDEP